MGRLWRLSDTATKLTSQLVGPLRFGALVPWANIAMEAELPYILPREVIWHFARLVPPCHSTAIEADFLKGMVDAIPHALFELSHIPLNAVAFGCTSASFSYPEFVGAALEATSPKGPLLTAFAAILRTLEYYGSQNITLLTPYEEQVTQGEICALSANGINVVRAKSLGYRDGIGEVSASEVIDAGRRVHCQQADAVVVSCTALHSLETIEVLERQLQVPVLSSNSSIALALVLACSDQDSLNQGRGE